MAEFALPQNSKVKKGKTKIDYRPVHEKPMTEDMKQVPPKARVY